MANDSSEYARKDRQLDVRKGAHTESEGGETSVSRRNYLKLAGSATAAAVAAAGVGSASSGEQQYGEGWYGENAFGGTVPDGGETDGNPTDNAASSDPVVEQFEISERNRRNPHAEFVIDWGVSDPDEALDRATITVATTDGNTLETEMINVTGASASGSDKIRRKHGDGESYVVSLVVSDEYDNVSSRETTIDV